MQQTRLLLVFSVFSLLLIGASPQIAHASLPEESAAWLDANSSTLHSLFAWGGTSVIDEGAPPTPEVAADESSALDTEDPMTSSNHYSSSGVPTAYDAFGNPLPGTTTPSIETSSLQNSQITGQNSMGGMSQEFCSECM